MNLRRESAVRTFQIAFSMAVIMLGIAAVQPATAQSARYSATADAPSLSPSDLLQRVVDNELRADRNDHTNWMYKDIKISSGNKRTWEYIETNQGNIERLLSINGRPLGTAGQAQQQDRISWIAAHPFEARKLQEGQEQDAQKGQQMLSVLPKALAASYGARDATTIELDFRPNPRFHPDSREEQVFHSMSGKIIVDRKEDRLVSIDGHLAKPVEFWHGILGHLDRGGQFEVVQSEVEPGHWEITRLRVNMRGKALFFKTIGVQQNETRTDYQEVPGNTSLAQAADMLSHASAVAER